MAGGLDARFDGDAAIPSNTPSGFNVFSWLLSAPGAFSLGFAAGSSSALRLSDGWRESIFFIALSRIFSKGRFRILSSCTLHVGHSEVSPPRVVKQSSHKTCPSLQFQIGGSPGCDSKSIMHTAHSNLSSSESDELPAIATLTNSAIEHSYTDEGLCCWWKGARQEAIPPNGLPRRFPMCYVLYDPTRSQYRLNQFHNGINLGLRTSP